MTTPALRTVVAYGRDLLFSSRIGETARRLGYPFRAVRSVADLSTALAASRPALLMVDLTAPAGDVEAVLGAIEAAGRPAPVLAWTTHALWKTTKPHHARCDRVVTRETLTAELPELLRAYVEGGERQDAAEARPSTAPAPLGGPAAEGDPAR
jgi:DNA-binding NtrC family response regulator